MLIDDPEFTVFAMFIELAELASFDFFFPGREIRKPFFVVIPSESCLLLLLLLFIIILSVRVHILRSFFKGAQISPHFRWRYS